MSDGLPVGWAIWTMNFDNRCVMVQLIESCGAQPVVRDYVMNNLLIVSVGEMRRDLIDRNSWRWE